VTLLTQSLALGGVVLIAAMAPGPDFLVVMRNAMVSGRRAGIAAAAGIASGVAAWAVVTSVGVAGLLAASAVAFTIVKLIGAAYLVLLGIRALIAARRGGYAEMTVHGPAQRGAAAAFRQGLITNLLNPKVAVFFVALLPQFLPHSATAADTIALSATAAVVSLVWFTLLATMVSAMRRLLTGPKVRRAIDAVTGGLMVAIGVRIAVQ
jgi:RhtB (resistance to homoserine/threonine) family protein